MAIASGRAIEWVRQMDRLFPSTDHSISYFTGESGKPRWISKVGVHGRYVLIGETEVAFNEDRTKITTHSNPRFHLIEITKITEDPKTGQVLIENGETEAEFGLDEWKKLVEKNGDFASIGVKVVKDKPVLLFDKHWKKAG